MIRLPDGFNLVQFFFDIFGLAAPFVAIAFLFGAYHLLQKLAKTL